MKKAILILIRILFLTIIVYSLLIAIMTFFTQKDINLSLFFHSFLSIKTNLNLLFISIGTELILEIVLFFNNTTKRLRKRVLFQNDDLEDTRWQSDRDQKHNPDIFYAYSDDLKETQDGIIIGSKIIKGRMEVKLLKPSHTLVIGTTGSGKSQCFIMPMISVLSRCKTKPIMVITDPKGEIYQATKINLESQGYKVLLYDLDKPIASQRWNPFSYVIMLLKSYRKERNESILYDKENNIYVYKGVKYTSSTKVEIVKSSALQVIESDIEQEIEDIINVLCPIKNKEDENWERAARDFIIGFTMQLVSVFKEAKEEPDYNKLNLYNIYANINKYVNPTKLQEEDSTIQKYFNLYGDNANAKGKARTILDSQDRTLASFLSNVNNYISWLGNTAIQQCISGDDFDLFTFDEQPTALFIKLDVARADSNTNLLATILISQVYRSLNEKGKLNKENGETPTVQMKRKCYLMLDEFGNIPRISIARTIATYGRSNGFVFIPVLQSYEQLKIYKEDENVIKGNCNITVYLGSNDNETNKKLSEEIGKTKRSSLGFSSSKDISSNVAASSVPLINPTELATLNKPGEYGKIVVRSYKHFPIKSEVIAVHKAMSYYGNGEVYEIEPRQSSFDKNESFYDINKVLDSQVDSVEEMDDEELQRAEESLKEVPTKSVEEQIEDKKRKAIMIFEEWILKLICQLQNTLTDKEFRTLFDYASKLNYKPMMSFFETTLKHYISTGRMIAIQSMVKIQPLLKQHLNKINEVKALDKDFVFVNLITDNPVISL